jgi:hypothetical protein
MSRDGSAVGIAIEDGLEMAQIAVQDINEVGVFRLEP